MYVCNLLCRVLTLATSLDFSCAFICKGEKAKINEGKRRKIRELTGLVRTVVVKSVWPQRADVERRR